MLGTARTARRATNQARQVVTAAVQGDALGIGLFQAKFGTGSYQGWNGSTSSNTTILVKPSPPVTYVPGASNFASPEFTAEFWYYAEQYPTVITNFWTRQGFSTNWRFLMQSNGIPQLRYRFFNPYPGTLTERVISGTSDNGIALDTWHHLAFSQSDTTIRFFQNGVLVATQTEPDGFIESGSSDAGWRVGQGANGMQMYLDELRISTSCRYTDTFVPSQVPFSPDADTVMLLHFDEPPGSKTFSTDPIGLPRLSQLVSQGAGLQLTTDQRQYGFSSARTTSGSTDWVQIQGVDIPDDWTMEGWFRINSATTKSSLFGWTNGTTASTVNLCILNGKIAIESDSTTSGTTSLGTNEWYHLAWVRDSGSVKLYVDGALEATHTDIVPVPLVDQQIYMCGNPGANLTLDGWHDDLRISRTARYTAAFTPPQSALTNDALTVCLLNMEGTTSAVIRDNNGIRPQQVVNSTGSAVPVLDTGVSRFGASSMLFQGNSQLLTTGLDFGPDDWTIEFWLRRIANSGGQVFDIRTSTDTSGSLNLTSTGGDAGKFTFGYGSGQTAFGNTALAVGEFSHVAVVRTGSALRLYINGTEDSAFAVTNLSTNFGYNRPFRIGQTFQGSLGLTAYIDELRISRTARYTAAFTAPGLPFRNERTNTQLLLHFDHTAFEDDFY